MSDSLLARRDNPIIAVQMAGADESLVPDVRGQIGPAEMVENRLQRLLPTGSLPVNSSTFRVR